MQSFSTHITLHGLREALQECARINPTIVLLFVAPQLIRSPELQEALKQPIGNAQVAACTTSGEIGRNGVVDDSIAVLAMRFDSSTVKATVIKIGNTDESFNAGARAAAQLDSDDLKGVLAFCPGLNINGSAFVRGLDSKLADHIVISGGLAGDGTDFSQTFTCLNGSIYEDHAIVLGIYGPHVHITTGSKGGWAPFGPARRVTRSRGSVLYELDGKPALELYEQYLGDKAKDLPASGLYYPFAILREDKSLSGLIRTILNVDYEQKSLILAGDLEEGSIVCLMHSDTDSLIEGAEGAAESALSANAGDCSKSAAILVSCVGRRLVMKEDTDEEVESAMKILGENTHFAGFYSYGEICPFKETGRPELHNQTMTITLISEKPAA